MARINKKLQRALKMMSPEGLKQTAEACGETAQRLHRVADLFMEAKEKFAAKATEAGTEFLQKAEALLNEKD